HDVRLDPRDLLQPHVFFFNLTDVVQPVGNVLSQNYDSLLPLKLKNVTLKVNLNGFTVLFDVDGSPFGYAVLPSVLAPVVLLEKLSLFGRLDFQDRHGQKFLPAKTIMLYRRVIDIQKF